MGLIKVVQTLMSNGRDSFMERNNMVDFDLLIASNGGFGQTVFRSGGDINCQRIFYGTALYGASANGHERIVQILLDHCADVNAQPVGERGTALQAALVHKHDNVVQILREAISASTDGQRKRQKV